MPQKNRNAVIVAAALILMGVIFYGYYSVVYAPTSKQIDESKRKIDGLNKKIADAKARASQLNKIQAEMQSLEIEVVQLEKQLPKGRELPSMIRVVTHRAEAYGLTLSNFQPSKPVAKGLYDEIPYSISLSASFHTLGRFLTAMGKGERLFATRNLALMATNNRTDPGKTVNATFQLIAFKYHE